MTVGDIKSDAVGSAARYNSGKPPMELIPIRVLAEAPNLNDDVRAALTGLAQFQEGGGAACLYDVIKAMDWRWDWCARVFDYGRGKYAEWNWAKGMQWSIPLACAVRHLQAIDNGEENDPESGLPHAGHVICNVVMLLVYLLTYPEGDDRPVKTLGRRPLLPGALTGNVRGIQLPPDTVITAEAAPARVSPGPVEMLENKPPEAPWHPWSGDACPVTFGTVVEAKLRDGMVVRRSAGCMRWYHTGQQDDIAAWRRLQLP